MSKTSPINVKEFSLHSGKWNTYISQLTAWFDINDVKPDARTKYLIAVVGSETLDLIIDLCYPSEPHEVSYDDIVSKVREHLSPKRSELAERMCFRACKQTSEQSITEYVARLKQLAQKCNFTGTAYLEENLRDQLAYGIRSEAIRFKLLTETKLTFSRAVEIATSLEAADRDSKASGPGGGAGATSSTAMSVKEEGVHAMRAGGGGGARAPSRRRNSTAAASRERCPRCLGPHHPRRCSFINTECYVCGKKGHIAKACKKRKTHSVNVCSESMDPGSENEPEEDDEYDVPLYMVGGDDSDEPWWRTVKVNGVNMRMQLDSGSAVSVVSYKFCNKLFKNVKLEPTAINLKMYSGQKIVPKGTLPCEVMYNNKTISDLSLVVVDSKDSPPIMGRRWMTALGIDCNHKSVYSVQSKRESVGTQLAQAFPQVFAPGTGKFTGKPIQLTVARDARPVLCKPRPVPHALRASVETELRRLQTDGVISPIETSEWGTPVVPVIKQSGENSPNQEPVYRKVAIVENFFDIIYTVHVELEGRPGKHAGQKRTYRTITETYAFLPREAVTRFLTGCAECARRPRSASPPPLPTPSPSPTRHPTYLPFLPHCPTDYTRNWESEIDAAHNYPYEPKFDYTELQPIKKVESPKVTDSEDQEPTYIELTSKKVNGFDSNALFSRCSPVEPAFREEEPVRTDPEIDKDDNSLIDVEDVKIDSPAPRVIQKIDTEENSEKETKAKENVRVKEEKTDDKKQKKYNPLDVANLTAKDPPKSASPPRKKLLPSSLEYSNSFGRFPKPWRPDGGVYFGGEEVDYSVPITTAYLKHMRSMAYQERVEMENKDNLTPEPADMNDDDNFSSQAFAKDAEKLKMMLLAWNYHSQTQGRNGDITEIGADSMADLWASYHSALGLGSKPPKPPTPLATGHSSPIHVGSATPVEPASTHDETSSSDRTKDDDDAGASDDDSDDRVDPHHHDPERLKAFNMFVRLFVDENLDRIVPISKQPKEKIQAIIDSCTRQFPEFAERARKRIRTYLKSCRRNKKVRGDGPATGNGGNNTGTANAWDTAVRPTPAHLTSVQAEHILAQACENESLNAKRMRLGLDPVSQPMPTVPTPMAIDTTATSAVASSFLSLYSGAINPSSAPATSTSNTASASAPAPAPAPAHSKAAADTTRPSVSPTLENPLLNNNSLKLDNANGNTGSKTASPSSSPAPLFRPSFPTTFGTPQTFGRQSSNTNPATALSSSALLSTLSALPPSGVGVNAAMAAYQSALLSAMAAHTHSFPTNLSAPTDLSLKSPAPAVHPAPTLGSGKLLSHKLSGAEVGAVRQLITGYRESAAFLLRSADELEALLLNQP